MSRSRHERRRFARRQGASIGRYDGSSGDFQPESTSPAQQAIEEAEELQEVQYEADLNAVLATPAGRRLLGRILIEAGMFDTGIERDANNRLDSHVLAYRAGRRDFVELLDEEIQQLAPDAWLSMRSEMLLTRAESDPANA